MFIIDILLVGLPISDAEARYYLVSQQLYLAALFEQFTNVLVTSTRVDLVGQRTHELEASRLATTQFRYTFVFHLDSLDLDSLCPNPDRLRQSQRCCGVPPRVE